MKGWNTMVLVDYLPCRQCENSETWGILCVKCGKCGRKFEDGILVNGNEYPGYDSDMEDD